MPHKPVDNASGRLQDPIRLRASLLRRHRNAFTGRILSTLSQAKDALLDLDQIVHLEAAALNSIDAQPTDFDNISSTRRKMLELLDGKHRQDYADLITCMGIGYFDCAEYQNSINLFNTLLAVPDSCDTAQVRLELARACGRLAEQWLLESKELKDKATELLDTALGHLSAARKKEFIGLDKTEIFELELLERRFTAVALVLRNPDAGLEYACDQMIVERMDDDEGSVFGAINTVSAILAKVRNPQSKINPLMGVLGSEIAADYHMMLAYEELRNRIANAAGFKCQPQIYLCSCYWITLHILEKRVLDPKPFLDAIQNIINENDELDIELETIYKDHLSRLPQAVRDHIFADILIFGTESAVEITLKWIAANLPYDEIAQIIIKVNEANSSLGKRLAARLLHEYIDFMVENRSDEPKLKEKLQALLKDARGKGKELFFQPVVVQAEINLKAKSKLIRDKKKQLEAEKIRGALEAQKQARLSELMSGTKFISLKDYHELIVLLKEQGSLQAGLDLMKQLAAKVSDLEPVFLLADALWQADATLRPQLRRYFNEWFADEPVNKAAAKYLKEKWESLSTIAQNIAASENKRFSKDKTAVNQAFFEALLGILPVGNNIPASFLMNNFVESERAFDFVFVELRDLIVVGQMAAQITNLPYRTPVSFMSCWKAIFSRQLKELEAIFPAAQHNRLKRARISLFHEALAIDTNNITAAFELASICITAGSVDEAEQYLEKIRLDPEDVAAKVRLFALENNGALLKIYQLLSQGKKEKAMAVYLANMEKYRKQRIKEELEANPNDTYLLRQKPFIEVNLGFLHLSIGNYQEARVAFDVLLMDDPYNTTLTLGYVLSLVFEGKMNEVLDFLEQALSRATAKGGLAPTDSKLFQLYQAYVDMLDLVGHTALASEYCLNEGAGLLVSMKLCRFSILEGQLDEAEKKLEEIKVLLKNAEANEIKKLQSFYSLVRAEYLNKRLLQGQGSKQQVEEAMFSAIDSFSRMPGVPFLELFSRFVLARIYAEWGFRRNEKDAKRYLMLSSKAYEKILERWPNFTPAQEKLAAVLLTEKAPEPVEWTPKYHFPKPLALANKFVVESPLGQAYLALERSQKCNDFEKAYNDFSAFFKEHPEYNIAKDLAGILFNWANYLESQKQYGTAVEKLRQALQFDPDSSRIKGFLAKLLVNLTRYDEAMPFAQAAHEAEPDEVMNLNTLGYLYLLDYHEKNDRNLLQKARQLIEKALEIDPNLVHLWLNLSLVLLEYDEYNKAFEAFTTYAQKQNDLFPLLQFSTNLVSLPEVEQKLSTNDLAAFFRKIVLLINFNSMKEDECAQLIIIMSIWRNSGQEEAASVVETFLADNPVYQEAARQVAAEKKIK